MSEPTDDRVPVSENIVRVTGREIDRLRAIEEAARTFFEDEHECLHEPDPPCGLALLRAALEGAPHDPE